MKERDISSYFMSSGWSSNNTTQSKNSTSPRPKSAYGKTSNQFGLLNKQKSNKTKHKQSRRNEFQVEHKRPMSASPRAGAFGHHRPTSASPRVQRGNIVGGGAAAVAVVEDHEMVMADNPFIDANDILMFGGMESSPRPLGPVAMEMTKAHARMALLQLRAQSVQCTKHGPTTQVNVVSVRPESARVKRNVESKIAPVFHGHGDSSKKKNKNKKSTTPKNVNPTGSFKCNTADTKVKVVNNEELVSNYLSDERADHEYILQQRREHALNHLQSRIAMMRKTYNAIKAEGDEWLEKQRKMELDRDEVFAQVAAQQQEIEDLQTRVYDLKVKLGKTVERGKHLGRYGPVLEHMLDRYKRETYDRSVRIQEVVESIQLIKDCQDECLSLSQVVIKESATVKKQREHLELSLTDTEQKYFEKLGERRELINKVDALTNYFAKRENNRNELKRNLQVSKAPRKITTLQKQLQVQELHSIVAIISHKGSISRKAIQQLGTGQYTPRQIQDTFRTIEERSGVKIITPQELLDWAYANQEIQRNIQKEENIAQSKLRELTETKTKLVEQLTLLDQKSGNYSNHLQRSAYEELHRKILQEKQRKQIMLSRIQDKRSTLASFSVSVGGLAEKLDNIDLKEDWVFKLDTSLLLSSSTNGASSNTNGNGGNGNGNGTTSGNGNGIESSLSPRSNGRIMSGRDGAFLTQYGSMKTSNRFSDVVLAQEGQNGTRATELGKMLSNIKDKLESVLKLCHLGQDVGLLKMEDQITDPPAPISERLALVPAPSSDAEPTEEDAITQQTNNIMNRINLLHINEPDQERNVRIEARKKSRKNDDNSINNMVDQAQQAMRARRKTTRRPNSRQSTASGDDSKNKRNPYRSGKQRSMRLQSGINALLKVDLSGTENTELETFEQMRKEIKDAHETAKRRLKAAEDAVQRTKSPSSGSNGSKANPSGHRRSIASSPRTPQPSSQRRSSVGSIVERPESPKS